jgi:hypothetical protein
MVEFFASLKKSIFVWFKALSPPVDRLAPLHFETIVTTREAESE